MRRDIVFLNPWERLIGPNRYLAELLLQLPGVAARSIIALDSPGDAAGEYRDMGCRVEVWPEVSLVHPSLRPGNLARLGSQHTSGLGALWRRLRRMRPHRVVSNTENLWVGGLACRVGGFNHMQVVHSLVLDYRWSGFPAVTAAYLRCLAAIAGRFVAVSEAVRRMLAGYGIAGRRVLLAVNGFDPGRIRRQSREALPGHIEGVIGGRRPLIVTAGRLAPMKGQDVLLDALSAVRARFPDAMCLFIGKDGGRGAEDVPRYRRKLSGIIAARGLERSVHFLGESEHVPALLARADVYVHPSRTESFCRTAAEALLLARAVVCSDVGGLPEVVGRGGGLLVAPGDREGLSRALVRVLSDDGLRRSLGESGRRHVEGRYCFPAPARPWAEALA